MGAATGLGAVTAESTRLGRERDRLLVKHSLIKPRSTDEVSGGLVDRIRRISQIERRLPVESAMCTVLVVVREGSPDLPPLGITRVS